MASMTFDLQWKEAMVELLDQLQEMDPEAAAQLRQVSIYQCMRLTSPISLGC